MGITGIKETCLYVSDLERTRDFYSNILELPVIALAEERHVFFRVGDNVLLCFNPEVTKKEKVLPPHFAEGKMHIAFEVPESEYQDWMKKLKSAGIKIVHEQKWKQGRRSFYFMDPDGHVLEIIQPGIWD